MLAAQYRLRSGRDIRRVYARGRFGPAKGLTAKALPNRLNFSRAVVVVGRKVSNHAVIRNRIRRRLAAILAAAWQTVPAGYDIVVTVSQDLSSWTAAELKQSLESALKRTLTRNKQR
jgi:ribonuclease P protein component